MAKTYDVSIIGGGFYGTFLACFFSYYFKNVLLIEKESDLLTRASCNNQIRVHNGYHYPRSFLTASRSHRNFETFTREFEQCINKDLTKLYAIPKYNNKVTSQQFVQFCKQVQIPLSPVTTDIKNFFDKNWIQNIFEVQEYLFDPQGLRDIMKNRLYNSSIDIHTNTQVEKIYVEDNILHIEAGDKIIKSNIVVNCAYSQINTVNAHSSLELLPLKHELAEMVLVKAPSILKNYGITLMDGPFFSLVPYPNSDYHLLSHVRFTPHHSWTDQTIPESADMNFSRNATSQAHFMIKDSQRYMPAMKNTQYVKSIFEVKTVLTHNESNDGRPILFRKDYGFPNYHIVMGGKIDNVYDIVNTIQQSDIISRFQ